MPRSKPTIYLIAGCNGAGKTTFAKEFLSIIRNNTRPPAKVLASSNTHTILELREML